MSRTAHRHLQDGRYTYVLWNSVPGNWMNPNGWVDVTIGDVRRLDWTLLVVHDLPTGAMKNLESFITRASELGAQFTDEFPDACVPIRKGVTHWDMTPWMTER